DRARDFSRRTGGEVKGVHLLFALCVDRATAAYRAIEQCGSDVAKLRGCTVQLAMGIAQPRRATQTGLLASRSSAAGGIVELRSPAGPSAPVPARGVAPAKHATAKGVAKPHEAPALAKRRVASDDPFALDPKRFPLLSGLGKNLTSA